MENITSSHQPIEQKTLAKNFVANVFSMMFIALIVSGITAVWFASSGMINPTPDVHVCSFCEARHICDRRARGGFIQ